MRTFEEFADYVFPGQLLERNPEADRSSRERYETPEQLVREVSQCTGISYGWLDKSLKLVINGLAGLGCLDYLHGAQGMVTHKPKIPDWLKEATSEYKKKLRKSWQKKFPIKSIKATKLNWDKGYIYYRITYEPVPGAPRPKEQRIKIGKLLRGVGLWEKYRRAFEDRQLSRYEFRISTDPLDVLTMSYGRPWSQGSCMQPGEPAEFGPLTDMAAGTALMLFYPPGGRNPCGRTILRPCVSVERRHGRRLLDTGIVPGGRTYGCGPSDISDKQLQDLLYKASGFNIRVVGEELCELGKDGLALSRGIWADPEWKKCAQGIDQYEDAYENLSNAPWPVMREPVSVLSKKAERFFSEDLPGDFSGERYPDGHEIDNVAAFHAEALLSEAYSAVDMAKVLLSNEDGMFVWIEDYEIDNMFGFPVANRDEIVDSLEYAVLANIRETISEHIDYDEDERDALKEWAEERDYDLSYFTG